MNHKYLNDILPKGKSPYDFEFDDEFLNNLTSSEAEEETGWDNV